jgi:hypothetical protein
MALPYFDSFFCADEKTAGDNVMRIWMERNEGNEGLLGAFSLCSLSSLREISFKRIYRAEKTEGAEGYGMFYSSRMFAAGEKI